MLLFRILWYLLILLSSYINLWKFNKNAIQLYIILYINIYIQLCKEGLYKNT